MSFRRAPDAKEMQLIRDLRPLFAARFPGSSRAWIHALTDRAAALPSGDGLLWATDTGTFEASRL